MHYVCVHQYKDMCGRAYDIIRKRKTSGNCSELQSQDCMSADYAVNLECITHVSNTKIGVTRAYDIRKRKTSGNCSGFNLRILCSEL